MNLIFTKEQAAQIVSGALREAVRPCHPQPFAENVENAGHFWIWQPAKIRTFFDLQPPDALRLPGIEKHAPFAPGDVVSMREPYFHVRTEPNGDYVLRYGDGEELSVTPDTSKPIRIRWPGKWNAARNMYNWMERYDLKITDTRLVRATKGSQWMWIFAFEPVRKR